MNLAQLVDPEWAQQGYKERHAPVRPEGLLPPMGLVQRNTDGMPDVDAGLARRTPKVWEVPAQEHRPSKPRRLGHMELRGLLLKQIASYGERGSARAADLVREIGGDRININTACAALYSLLAHGLVRRHGAPRDYKYAITAAGRKALG